MHEYYVYIMASAGRTLYVGVTNDLQRRVWEHKQKLHEGFTKKYNVDKLVYCESTPDIASAVLREKRLKRWHRQWKMELIEKVNPEWKDLAEDWYEAGVPEVHLRRLGELPG
jgi:putative endonuclease